MIPPKGRSFRCVLLFARAPLQEERVKGIRGAAGLFALAIRRLSECLDSLPDVDVVIAGAECGSGHFAKATVIAQRGETFGERFENAFSDTRALGYAHVVAVPIDVPALGAREIAASFARLVTDDVVLGPSPDGGVYLVGSRLDAESLFKNVPWQTEGVFFALLRNAGEAVVLGSLLDIDRRSDLELLAAGSCTDPELQRLLETLLRLGPEARPLSVARSLRLSAEACSSGRSPPILLASF